MTNSLLLFYGWVIPILAIPAYKVIFYLDHLMMGPVEYFSKFIPTGRWSATKENLIIKALGGLCGFVAVCALGLSLWLTKYLIWDDYLSLVFYFFAGYLLLFTLGKKLVFFFSKEIKQIGLVAPPFLSIAALMNVLEAYNAKAKIISSMEWKLLCVLPLVWVGIQTYKLMFAIKDRPVKQKSLASTSGQTQSIEGQRKPSSIEYVADKARYTFRDVHGMAELKDKLLKAGWQVFDPSVHQPKNGILLSGDPGNGKTFIAEALAGHLKVKFMTVTFGNIASMWVGETTQRAMKVFDDAIAQAPCVLFLDEIDAVFVDRGSIRNADSEAPKTLNAILTRLVDIRSKGVLVMAATNHMDKLDAASIREGRFDYKITVPHPDKEARISLLKQSLRHIRIDAETLDSLATRWEGYSVSRIMAIGHHASEKAREEYRKSVDFEYMMQSLRMVQGSKGDKIPENVPNVDGLYLSVWMRKRMENLIERMLNIEVTEKFGGNAPTGILLHGPAGTGKTLGAMVLAKSANWAFIQTTGNALLNDPDQMDTIMKRAADIRPCLVFIDEADDLLENRNSSFNKSATNRLLSIMDGAGGRPKDILFVAATNYPEMIDEAMLRGGRFTEKIEFSRPDMETTRTYIADWIKACKAPLSDDFTIEGVLPILEGQSLANMKVILQGSINECITKLSRDKDAKVELRDLVSSLFIFETGETV